MAKHKKNKWDNWTEKDYQKEIEILRKKKTYGLVWEEDKTKEVFDYYINWDGEQTKESFGEEDNKFPVLKEVKSKSIDNEDPKYNLMIEGDNYHSLATLSFTHNKAIDVIYIDPPYNSGKDKEWKYNDNWIDKEDGYKHSKWLSFMSKRLKLVKNILKKGGIIFVSIDNHEFAQLKILMDDIFGEENLVEIFSWVKTSTPPALSNKTRKTNEYILCYENGKTKEKYFAEELSGGDQPLLNRGNNQKDLIFPKNKVFFKIEDTELKKGEYDRVELKDDIKIENGYSNKNFIINGEFKWTQLKLDKEIKKGTTFIIKSKNLSIRFLRENDESYKSPTNYIKENIINPQINKKEFDVGTNETASSELQQIFHKKIFDNPKPVSLIKYLINFNRSKNITILDFFAGSGTTGHAVMSLNKEDGGKRKFILCTNNEDNNQTGLRIASDICYPRIKKVIEGYANNKGEKIEGYKDNFKYFKTDFVDSAPTDQNKKKIVDKSTEMLCIKENAFKLIKENQGYKIFKNTDVHLGIIFDEEEISDFIKDAKEIDGKFHVYLFSLDNSIPEKEFKDMKGKVKLCAIPEAILHVYRRVFR